MIGIELYIPIFVIAMSATLAGLGNLFRRHQQHTDWDMLYERMPEQAKTNRVIIEALAECFNSNTEISIKLKNRIQYLKDIEEGKQPGGS